MKAGLVLVGEDRGLLRGQREAVAAPRRSSRSRPRPAPRAIRAHSARACRFAARARPGVSLLARTSSPGRARAGRRARRARRWRWRRDRRPSGRGGCRACPGPAAGDSTGAVSVCMMLTFRSRSGGRMSAPPPILPPRREPGPGGAVKDASKAGSPGGREGRICTRAVSVLHCRGAQCRGTRRAGRAYRHAGRHRDRVDCRPPGCEHDAQDPGPPRLSRPRSRPAASPEQARGHAVAGQRQVPGARKSQASPDQPAAGRGLRPRGAGDDGGPGDAGAGGRGSRRDRLRGGRGRSLPR